MYTLAELQAQRGAARAKLNRRDGQPGYGANALTIRAHLASLDEQIAELEAVEAAEGDNNGEGQAGAPV